MPDRSGDEGVAEAAEEFLSELTEELRSLRALESDLRRELNSLKVQ